MCPCWAVRSLLFPSQPAGWRTCYCCCCNAAVTAVAVALFLVALPGLARLVGSLLLTRGQRSPSRAIASLSWHLSSIPAVVLLYCIVPTYSYYCTVHVVTVLYCSHSVTSHPPWGQVAAKRVWVRRPKSAWVRLRGEATTQQASPAEFLLQEREAES